MQSDESTNDVVFFFFFHVVFDLKSWYLEMVVILNPSYFLEAVVVSQVQVVVGGSTYVTVKYK